MRFQNRLLIGTLPSEERARQSSRRSIIRQWGLVKADQDLLKQLIERSRKIEPGKTTELKQCNWTEPEN